MIGWYVHDHGSGHRRRLEAVAPHLSVPVTGMGSGPAARGVGWLPLPSDATGAPGAAAVDPTAGGALHWAPLGEAGMLGRAQAVAEWVRASGCRLLVVDVSVEMLLLARLLGVATVAVVQPGVRDDAAHRLGYDTAAALLAPWPREAGPSGLPADRRSRTVWTGAFSLHDRADGDDRAGSDDGTDGVDRVGSDDRRDEPASVEGAPGCLDGGRCVALVLGTGGHQVARADVHAAAAATPDWCWHVAGDLGAARGAVTSGGRLVEHGVLPDVRGLLRHAAVVVGPSGGGLVAEVAASGRPFLALPQRRPFDEQHELARLLQRLGCATVAETWPAPSAWPGLLARVVAMADDAPRRWAGWSDGRGAQRAAALVERTLVEVATGGRPPARVVEPGTTGATR